MRRIDLAVIGALLLAGGGTALALHGGYEKDFVVGHPASIEGDIEDLLFANPHVVLKIRTSDSILYTATWERAARVEQYGVSMNTLKVGNHVIVSGAPSRNPTLHELALLRELRRPRPL